MTHLVTWCGNCNTEFHYTPDTSPVGRVICCGRTLGEGAPYVPPPDPTPTPAGFYTAIEHPGRAHWRKLHVFALEFAAGLYDITSAKQWLAEWEALIPSLACSCGNHWQALMQLHPLPFDKPLEVFQWTVDRHNDVNVRLSKPSLSLQDASELYSI